MQLTELMMFVYFWLPNSRNLWLQNASLVTPHSKSASFSSELHQIIFAKLELLDWILPKRELGK